MDNVADTITELFKLKTEYDYPLESFNKFRDAYLERVSQIMNVAYYIKALSSYMRITPKYCWDNYAESDVKENVEWFEVNKILIELDKIYSHR